MPGGITPAPPPDASSTVRGVVNLLAQAFSGLKTFAAGIVLNAKLTFAGFTGTTFENSVANGAGAVGFEFNNTVSLATTGARAVSFKDAGTEFASFQREPTYGDMVLTIPVPASTVPTIRLGTLYISTYGGRFQFGTTAASDSAGVTASSYTAGGTTVFDNTGAHAGATYPMSVTGTGGYNSGSSNGISIFGDGSSGGALARGVMVGSANASIIDAFPAFSVCYGLNTGCGYPNAIVSNSGLGFLFTVLGSGKVSQRGTDGSATAGAQTVNKPSGKGKISSGATTCVITNNLVTSASVVRIGWEGDHGAARSWVVPGSGSFTVTLSGAASGATVFNFEVKEIQ